MKSVILSIFFAVTMSGLVYAGDLAGKYDIVIGKKSIHSKGKVIVTVFMDFFCSHCYKFDTKVAPLLKEEFGDRIEIDFIGYPFLYSDSYVPVEAYELARDNGKAEEMREAIFDSIYTKKKNAADFKVLENIANSIGLDGAAIKKGLTNRVKKKITEDNLAWAKTYKVRSTPTVIIDNNIKVKENTHENVKMIIAGILAND